MAEKHSAPPTSYDAFFHGLGQNRPLISKAEPTQLRVMRAATVVDLVGDEDVAKFWQPHVGAVLRDQPPNR